MRILIIIFATALTLSACSLFREASPTLSDGDYYMTGDSDCVYYRQHKTQKKILCHNSKKEPTGERTALTSQDMHYYAAQKERERATLQSLGNNLKKTNAALNNAASQIKQSGSSLEQYNNSTSGSYNTNPLNTPTTSPTIYTEGMCQGSVINNRCVGVILPLPGYGKKCHGPIVNGECRGAYY